MYNMKNEKWGSEIKAKNAERIARALGVKPQEVFPDYARAKTNGELNNAEIL